MLAQARSSYRHGAAPASTKGLWWVVFAASAVLYVATCQRGVSWQDSGKRQWRAVRGDLTGDLGLALAHPLWVAAGHGIAAAFGRRAAFGLNAFSGVGMAVALANLAAVTSLLTGRRWVGLAAAGMLAVTHTAWWLSTIAEVYTWSLAGLTAELWLLVLLLRRPTWRKLAALGLVNGLGLCIHNFALLPLPVYLAAGAALVVKKRLPAWSLAAAAGTWVAGAGLMLALVAQRAAEAGLGAAIHSALFGDYAAAVLNTSLAWRHARANAALAAMNFVSFLLPLAVLGWVRFRRVLGGPAAAAIGTITVVELLFVVRYPVPDQFMFLLPTLALVALAAGVGAGVLAGAPRRWRAAAAVACVLSVVHPPVFYGLAPSLARSAGVKLRRARDLPFRDETRYWLVPWKHDERSAEQFAAAALRQAAPDGVILPDRTSLYPLLLVGLRDAAAPGVVIQSGDGPLPAYDSDPQGFRRALGGRALYLVSPIEGYAPARLLADAEIRPPKTEGEVLHRAVLPAGT